jgi:hypothetical protein
VFGAGKVSTASRSSKVAAAKVGPRLACQVIAAHARTVLGALALWIAFMAAAVAGIWPGARWLAFVLSACAIACAGLAVAAGTAERSLDVVHQHPAFVGNQIETKDFPIETATAPGFAWGLASALACALLAGVVWTGLPRRRPVGYAILFGWLGIALALGLEKLAAPPDVLALRMHGAAWLASIAAAVALARTRIRLVPFAAILLLIITVIWLPSAIFGTLATRGAWGTSLDVHSIEFCAHRLAGTPLTLTPGSAEQMWYLLWAPLLVVFPLLCWMSGGGVGFLVLMARREDAARADDKKVSATALSTQQRAT